jgi:hypothetical protein
MLQTASRACPEGFFFEVTPPSCLMNDH